MYNISCYLSAKVLYVYNILWFFIFIIRLVKLDNDCFDVHIVSQYVIHTRVYNLNSPAQ